MKTSCGIDFGTSNSALAIAGAEDVTLALVEGQDTTLPSAIFYPFEGKAVFGRAAQKLFTEREEGRFMRSLKRILGTSLMEQGTVVNGGHKKFEVILEDFIGRMKACAEAQAGTALENVVMGRPVHFVDGDPDADARAQVALEKVARNIGFKNVEFQYEPIAAAFAHERNLNGDKLSLVADIGGGTSDFTLIRLSHQSLDKTDRKDDILANAGVRVGGNDFDKSLCLSEFMPHFGYGTAYGNKHLILPASPFHDLSEWSKVNFLYTPRMRRQMQDLFSQSHEPERFGRFLKILKEETGHQLLSAVEENKIVLTKEKAAESDLGFVEEELEIRVTRAGFNVAVEMHIQNISRSITECLHQAGIKEDAVELVILTGGTTEVPALKDAIRSRFPKAGISEENKLSSVATGLGYDSLRIFGSGHRPNALPSAKRL